MITLIYDAEYWNYNWQEKYGFLFLKLNVGSSTYMLCI